MTRFSANLLAAILLGLAPTVFAEARERVLLNGDWEMQIVKELTLPPPSAGWEKRPVPCVLRGGDYRRAWFRRTFVPPPAMAGKRMTIHFVAAKYNTQVYVNGQLAGTHFGGYEPFDVDVTSLVKADQPNELLVGVHDWTGLFDHRVDMTPKKKGEDFRDRPLDAVLAPVGGHWSAYGIPDDVSLVAHGEAYVADVFVKTSCRNKTISVDFVIANEGKSDRKVSLRNAALDGGERALELPAKEVLVKAGGTEKATVSAPWENPKLWSPDTPHLYELSTELTADGAPMDRLRTRFGFREIWVEGADYFLNGTRMKMRATSTWPPYEPVDRAYVEDVLRRVKQANTITHRLHTQPWPEIWYDVADEIGLMIVEEFAVWNDDHIYRIGDPKFWDNYADHIRRSVQRDKNHPSLIQWSLENEMYGARMNEKSTAMKDLVRMGQLTKELDPTRPITFESDGDPGGVADVIGVHYPHEPPQFNRWPNEAYWMDEPIRIVHQFPDEQGALWRWQHKKPLYIGEFLWFPLATPAGDTIFLGDVAYRDKERYHRIAKGIVWKMQIEAYRYYGVSGMCPWTMFEGGPLDETNPMYMAQKEGYEPNAVFVKEYDGRFYGDEMVERTLTVYNDLPRPAALDVGWSTWLDGKEKLESGAMAFAMGPAERQTFKIVLKTPKVDRRRELRLFLQVAEKGEKRFEDVKAYSVFPRAKLSLPWGSKVALFDPDGETDNLLRNLGVNVAKVNALSDVPAETGLLIIGRNALKAEEAGIATIGYVDPNREAVHRFVTGGGRLLVLPQQKYPEGLFPASLTDYSSTMTFPQLADHPALRDVQAKDLCFWRGDHIVTENEVARPLWGGGRPIVVSGCSAGLDHSPLLEVPCGTGVMMLCQMRLVDKLMSEPAAAVMLQGILDYLIGYRSDLVPVALVSQDRNFVDCLRTLGLKATDLTGRLAGHDLSGVGLLAHSGNADELAANLDRVEKFVAEGGRLLLHRLDPDNLRKIAKLFPSDVYLQRQKGPLTRVDGDPIGRAIFNEDLYWIGEHYGESWHTTPLTPDTCDYGMGKKLSREKFTAYEAEDFELQAHIGRKEKGQVGIYTVGQIVGRVEFPTSGRYAVGLRARGTPADGIYPMVKIAVDGSPIGTVTLASGEWENYAAFGQVEAGKRQVELAFINDGGGPGEDRNLFVDQVLIAPAGPMPTDLIELTSPPALVKVPKGKGFIVVDEVKWDEPGRNAKKQARYASSLLSAMGAEFEHKATTQIEAESMTPQPGMKHFTAERGEARLACNGYIETAIRCVSAGRYVFEVVAGGTPCAGVYPTLDLQIDERKVGTAALTTDGWRSYLIEADLAQGDHRLRICFTNDENRPPEDRNLFLDKVRVYRAE